MYYISICDDDLNFVNYIEKLLIDRLKLDIDDVAIYKYESGEELVNSFVKNIPFQLLILDMQMKGMNGDETAKAFRKRYPDAVLAFCSGVCHPTVKSFEANAYRYLLKEYDSNRMKKELDAILKEMKQRSSIPTILLSIRSETLFVYPYELLYVCSRKYGSNAYLYDKGANTVSHFECNKSMHSLFDEVGGFCFAYAHNSYFINLSYVISIVGNEVKLIDGTILTISRTREKAFKQALTAYLANRY